MYGNKYINIILDGYGGNTMEAVVNIDWIEGKGTKTIVYNSVKRGLINREKKISDYLGWDLGSNLSKLNPDKWINSACNRPKNVILSKVVANCKIPAFLKLLS